MAPQQSSQFKQIYITDNAGAVAEYSQYFKFVQIPKGNVASNVTAFSTGGGAVTNNQQKGSIQSALQPEVFFDPAIVYVLERLWGLQTGSLWQFLEGNNASPTPGDMMFQGTYTLFGMNFVYNTNQEATIQLDLRPTDGGTVIPGWVNV